MKSSKRKNVSKSSTPETSCSCADEIGGSICLTLLVVGLIGLAYYLLSGPKFEEGDCVLSRRSKVYQISFVNDEDYGLVRKRFSYEGMYSDTYYYETDYVTGDSAYTSDSIKEVDEHYIEVPCDR